MNKPVVLMVHGRSQGGKNKAELRETWVDTFRQGLPADKAKRLDEIDFRLPFYADELDRLAAQAGAFPADVATRGDPGGVDPEYAAFRLAIATEALEQAGIDAATVQDEAIADRGPFQWNWVQKVFQKLEAVPGLSGNMLERFTRDVWIYLKYPVVRDTVNDIVRAEMPSSGELFVVGHSLGSVVAYDVLRGASGISVPLFMTVGSPLGIREIVQRLRPIGHPAVAAKWYNAYDERDIVALRPLDAANFPLDPEVENYGEVQNRTDNAHGIIGYLNNKTVAQRLFDAVLG